MEPVGYAPQICARRPSSICSAIIIPRVVETALAILALTGILNRNNFIYSLIAVKGVETLAFASFFKGIGCCDRAGCLDRKGDLDVVRTPLWFAYLILTSIGLIVASTGGANRFKYAACLNLGLSVFMVSTALIIYGCKKKVEDDAMRTYPCC